MGIYIKGITFEEFARGIGFHKNSIIEVAEPHGDLIDRNEMQHLLSIGGINADLAKTIIEAEGEYMTNKTNKYEFNIVDLRRIIEEECDSIFIDDSISNIVFKRICDEVEDFLYDHKIGDDTNEL